jgi:hypothetical protein
LVNSTLAERHLTIDDSCAACAQPLRLAFRAGAIAEVEPASAYLWGGGT